MRHAREDYERFQDPAGESDRKYYELILMLANAYERGRELDVLDVVVGFFGARVETAKKEIAAGREFAVRAVLSGDPIGEDEPVFLLRGKDITAPDAVRHWADLAEREGASDAIVRAAREQAHRMVLWQAIHGKQVPDLPGEEV